VTKGVCTASPILPGPHHPLLLAYSPALYHAGRAWRRLEGGKVGREGAPHGLAARRTCSYSESMPRLNGVEAALHFLEFPT
jgi:hypothetical protein